MCIEYVKKILRHSVKDIDRGERKTICCYKINYFDGGHIYNVI